MTDDERVATLYAAALDTGAGVDWQSLAVELLSQRDRTNIDIARLLADLATAQATIAERELQRDAWRARAEHACDAMNNVLNQGTSGLSGEALKIAVQWWRSDDFNTALEERRAIETARDAALARETALREALVAVDSAILVRFKPTDRWYQYVIEPILNGVLGPDAQPPAAALCPDCLKDGVSVSVGTVSLEDGGLIYEYHTCDECGWNGPDTARSAPATAERREAEMVPYCTRHGLVSHSHRCAVFNDMPDEVVEANSAASLAALDAPKERL